MPSTFPPSRCSGRAGLAAELRQPMHLRSGFGIGTGRTMQAPTPSSAGGPGALFLASPMPA
eukprot:9220939-Lingulodinium_polyedra.AAC.1